MYAVVGIGQAGGNVSDEFAKRGFPSLAINFSKSDLDSLEYVEDKLRLIGSEGIGKQRQQAMKLMRNNWESTIEFIEQNFSKPSIEVVFIVFSTAGGTGSGISPFICELLSERMHDKTVVACPILPDYSEFVGNQINTQEALDELSRLNICTIPIDNQSILENVNRNLPKNKLYKEINYYFVELLTKIQSYTERNSKNGVLDKRDLKQLFSTNGITVISETKISDLSNFNLDTNHLMNTIQKSWKHTIFSPIQYERIIRSGIIFDGDESLMEYLRYEKLFDMFSHAPIELFEGNYHEGNGKVISILSGLNWIHNRVEKIDQIIEKQKLQLQNAENSTYKSNNLSKSSLFDSLSATKTIEKTSKVSVSEILNKYTR